MGKAASCLWIPEASHLGLGPLEGPGPAAGWPPVCSVLQLHAQCQHSHPWPEHSLRFCHSHSPHMQNPQSFLIASLRNPKPQAAELVREAAVCGGERRPHGNVILDRKDGAASAVPFPKFPLLSVSHLHSRLTAPHSAVLALPYSLPLSFLRSYLSSEFSLSVY